MSTPTTPRLPRGDEWKPLLCGAQNGTQDDFAALAEPLSHWIARYARPHQPQIHHGGSTVDDIVQDVLLALWNCLDAFEWRSDGHLLAWVHTVTRRHITRLTRAATSSSRPVPAGTPDDLDHLAPTRHHTSPDRNAEIGDSLRQLRPAVAALAPRRRDALVAHYLRDEPDDAIAARLGSSISSVRVARHRALASLRTTVTSTPWNVQKGHHR